MPVAPRPEGPTWHGFRRKLRLAMDARGLDAPVLARHLGWKSRRVKRLLTGETAPHIDDFLVLARALGVPPEALAFASEADFRAVIGKRAAAESHAAAS